MADEQEPVTPTKVRKIQKDDSFKTCKTVMPSPKTRRQLRMTPARNSILSGGTPFKESTSAGRKFNSRKKGSKRLNDTGGSNETFIRHEQDLLFDRDSLDVANHKMSSTPKHSHLPEVPDDLLEAPDHLPDVPDHSPELLAEVSKKPPETAKKTPETTKRPSETAKKPSDTSKKPFEVPKKLPDVRNKMPPPPGPIALAKSESRQRKVNRYITPRPPAFKKPPSSVISTASSTRCLSQLNRSRLTRTQSFKSTAELEREYFTSLRSRF